MNRASARRGAVPIERPDRAVIDVGSNTVRLVVYSGPPRAPNVWLNEKVTARLGRELAASRTIPAAAQDLALAGLERFVGITRELGISDVSVVATAAVRETSNGPQFVEQARALGLDVAVLSGEEEAVCAAFGVIGAFPGAHGTVADLGGGSLELISIDNGQCRQGASLMLGTLILPALCQHGIAAFRKAVKQQLQSAGWGKPQPGPLYLVGGTWRALALFAMHQARHPLSDPHAFSLAPETVDPLARKLAHSDPAAIAAIPGISANRASVLPEAAALLQEMVRQLSPGELVVSAWGLREGLLFRRLDPAAREQDPLLAAITHFATPRGASITDAALMAAWTADAVDGRNRGSERIRLAATMLTMAAARIEPNLRLAHATDWALEKRWVGLDHVGRVMIAQCLRASCGQPAIVPGYLRVASHEQLHRASAWGLANRLCRKLGAGTRVSLTGSALRRVDGRLVLHVSPERAHMLVGGVGNELARLADWLGLEHATEAGAVSPGQ